LPAKMGFKPYFIRQLAGHTAISADQSTLELEVIANGEPQPEFTWFVNGSEMTPANNIQIIQQPLPDGSGTLSRLTITELHLKSAEYSVEAKNQYGSAWSRTLIAPAKPPVPVPAPQPRAVPVHKPVTVVPRSIAKVEEKLEPPRIITEL